MGAAVGTLLAACGDHDDHRAEDIGNAIESVVEDVTDDSPSTT